jgi:low temperature requirement protein LtrA
MKINWKILQRIQIVLSILGTIAVVSGFAIQYFAIPALRENSALSIGEKLVSPVYTYNVFLVLIGIALIAVGIFFVYKGK